MPDPGEAVVPGDRERRLTSRRTFLREAGIATAAASDAMAGPARGATGRGRRAARPTVAVFGGGIAGMTAAHELAERGFDVTLYERRAWGGKARSTEVPSSAAGGRKALPGEVGARAVMGVYRNLPDTLRRIPFGSHGDSVLGNLVEAPRIVGARDNGRSDWTSPFGSRRPTSFSPDQIVNAVLPVLEADVPPDVVTGIVNRFAVYFSSCDARRADQWDRVSWARFCDADRHGDEFRKLVTITSSMAASGPDVTSADHVASAFESAVYGTVGRGAHGPLVQLFDAPTNDAWIDPWVAWLARLGVRLRLGATVKRLELRDGRIVRAQVRGPRGTQIARADWYVCALPIESAQRLIRPGIVAADPKLGGIAKLESGWMHGIKYFLRENRPLVNGVMAYVDAPWSLFSINQAQFWRADFASSYGDGQVRDCLSVVISDWTTPGVLYGKRAKDCSPAEIAAEVWEQIKRHVNDPGQSPRLADDLIHSWDIDPGMLRRGNRLISRDPLSIPKVGLRQHRPDVAGAIPNLILAGDYLQSDWWVGTMESANDAGRRAANVVLERARSPHSPATVSRRYRPPEWEPLKRVDAERHKRGEPNLLDADLTIPQLRRLLTEAGRQVAGSRGQ